MTAEAGVAPRARGTGAGAVEKGPDAFRTISEVADDLDLPQHVLRFWESRFPQIKPMKRGGGRRYYRPEDVELLRGIRHLLYGQGYTIKGVQRILKEQGVRFVMDVWRDPRSLGRVGASPSPADEGEEEIVPGMEGYDGEAEPEPAAVAPAEPLPAGILPDDAPTRQPFRFVERLRASETVGGNLELTRDEAKRLQQAMYELLECKRLLDQTR